MFRFFTVAAGLLLAMAPEAVPADDDSLEEIVIVGARRAVDTLEIAASVASL